MYLHGRGCWRGVLRDDVEQRGSVKVLSGVPEQRSSGVPGVLNGRHGVLKHCGNQNKAFYHLQMAFDAP